jgi:hypothetical protein
MFAVALVMLVAPATPSLAQYGGNNGNSYRGTAQEQDACRRDTRRYCRHVKAGAGNDAFLQCLQAHRTKLSKACGEVLQQHGM